MTQPPQRTVLLIAMAALLLLLSACGENEEGDPTASTDRIGPSPETSENAPASSSDLDPDGDGLLDIDEYELAVAQAVEESQWPDGYRVTPDTIVDTFTGGDPTGIGQMQVGLENTMVGMYNICAWHMAWLDAWQAEDSERQAEALDVMTNGFPERPGIDESTRDALGEIAESATLGDPSLVERDVSVNCDKLPFDQNAEQDSGTAEEVSIALPATTALTENDSLHFSGANRWVE